ncbi:MAG: acylphosphatase [Halobacteriota archaeon]
MKMKRAIIIARGKVQKVRYRSKIKEIADEVGIVGEAENLDDGSVRIVAEAEKAVLDDFIEKIKMKNYLIDVLDVSVSFEEATGEFSAFKKVISGTLYEVAERLDEAANVLERLTGVVMQGNEKIIGAIDSGNEMLAGKIDVGNDKIISTIKSGDKMLAEKIEAGNEKITSTIKSGNELLAGKIDVGNEKIISTIESGNELLAGKQDLMIEKLDNFHHDTIQGFDSLDTKYGRIAENMERILEELKEERKEYREAIEKLVNAIIESRKK